MKVSAEEGAQDRKYRLGLAGEFLVAGELLRRGLRAAVTYGNAKKADVVAVVGERALSIEVKTTDQDKWVVGSKAPDSTDQIWVLVHLPADGGQHPRYFILTGHEMHQILQPRDDAYRERYLAKHGKPYDVSKGGVCSVPRSLIQNHESRWEKITKLRSRGA